MMTLLFALPWLGLTRSQEAYSPDPREVEEASELVEAFEKHQEEGQGTFTFRSGRG